MFRAWHRRAPEVSPAAVGSGKLWRQHGGTLAFRHSRTCGGLCSKPKPIVFIYIYRRKDKWLVFSNIYRLSRAFFSCPLFSYISLDLPSFLGSPFFFVFLMPERPHNPLYLNKLSFMTVCRNNV